MLALLSVCVFSPSVLRHPVVFFHVLLSPWCIGLSQVAPYGKAKPPWTVASKTMSYEVFFLQFFFWGGGGICDRDGKLSGTTRKHVCWSS